MNQNQPTLSQRFPGGCYIGFNALIDRKAAEQLLNVVEDAARGLYADIAIQRAQSGRAKAQASATASSLARPFQALTRMFGGS